MLFLWENQIQSDWMIRHFTAEEIDAFFAPIVSQMTPIGLYVGSRGVIQTVQTLRQLSLRLKVNNNLVNQPETGLGGGRRCRCYV